MEQDSTAQHMRKQGNKAALAPPSRAASEAPFRIPKGKDFPFIVSPLPPTLPPVLYPDLAFWVCTELFALINMAKHVGVCHTAAIALLPVM